MTVIDIDFLDRLFLFGVGRRNAQQVLGKLQTHALELVGGKNGRALQAALQGFAVYKEVPRIVFGNHAGVVGELALDQLGNEFDVVEAEADLGGGHIDLHGVVGFRQQ